MKTLLPPDVEEAFGRPQTPAVLTEAEVDCFTPFVDASGRHYRTPPPSARHLRLIRRLQLVRLRWPSGAEFDTVVALADVSQLPAGCAPVGGEFPPILHHLKNLTAAVLLRSGARLQSEDAFGNCFSFSLGAGARKLSALLNLHRAFIGDEPAYAFRPDPSWASFATTSLEKFETTVRSGIARTGPA